VCRSLRAAVQAKAEVIRRLHAAAQARAVHTPLRAAAHIPQEATLILREAVHRAAAEARRRAVTLLADADSSFQQLEI